MNNPAGDPHHPMAQPSPMASGSASAAFGNVPMPAAPSTSAMEPPEPKTNKDKYRLMKKRFKLLVYVSSGCCSGFFVSVLQFLFTFLVFLFRRTNAIRRNCVIYNGSC